MYQFPCEGRVYGVPGQMEECSNLPAPGEVYCAACKEQHKALEFNGPEEIRAAAAFTAFEKARLAAVLAHSLHEIETEWQKRVDEWRARYNGTVPMPQDFRMELTTRIGDFKVSTMPVVNLRRAGAVVTKPGRVTAAQRARLHAALDIAIQDVEYEWTKRKDMLKLEDTPADFRLGLDARVPGLEKRGFLLSSLNLIDP